MSQLFGIPASVIQARPFTGVAWAPDYSSKVTAFLGMPMVSREPEPLAANPPPPRPPPSVHFSSARPDWNTPQSVIDLLEPLGPIDLDPCSNPTSIVPAREAWELERDGDSLVKRWGPRGFVYVNPPYGRELPRWIAKLNEEASYRFAGMELVALVPARTDTRWWCEAWGMVDAIAYWKGRIKFLGADNSAPFPSALLYWGGRPDWFKAAVSPRCLV